MASRYLLGNERYKGLCECGDHAWCVLTLGYVTYVSPEDAPILAAKHWQVYLQPPIRPRNVYAVGFDGRRKKVRLHRAILQVGLGVDHANSNGLDNRRRNLRPSTSRQNVANSRIANVAKTSRFKGVRLVRGSRWCAEIRQDSRKRHLGNFTEETDAARAYDAAAIAIFGEFARTNQMMGLLP